MIIFFLAAIAEKRLSKCFEFRTKNWLFLRPQLSLESKTITNQERIGSSVYPEITQISERSL